MLMSSGSMMKVNIDALADTTPLLAGGSYYGGGSLALSGISASYGAMFKTQLWVYAVVRKLAFGQARLPLKAYQRSDRGRDDASDTPYGQLLARPNPRMSAKRLWLWTRSTQEVYGEAIWVKLRDEKGQVREIHPIHPTNVVVIRVAADTTINGVGIPAGTVVYQFNAGTRATAVVSWLESDIVHFKGYNPDNLARGLSPLEPLRQTLLTEDAARRGAQAMWRNGARPSVILSTDKTLSKPAADRLRASWDEAHSGVDSWGKTAVLEEGMKPTIVQLNAEEMQYIASRHLNREEVCGAYDVPPPAVHILDRATFSNITEQMRSMYRDTMAPRLALDEDTLDSQLRPDFYPGAVGEVYGEFLMDEVLRGSFEQRTAANAQAIGTGQATPAEIRARENLPFIEGSDQLLVNAALIPLNIIESLSKGTGTDAEEVPQRIKALSPEDHRTVMGRLGRAEDTAAVDPETVLRGLEGGEAVRSLILAAKARNESLPALRRRVSALALEVA
jgi:HK97 family phage portal protein